MPQDSSSDRRFTCRACGHPRLRAVALLADDLKRAKLMCGRLCTDDDACRAYAEHNAPAFGPDATELPGLDAALDDESPELDPFDLPDSPDVKGDLDYHEWREEH